MNAQAYAAACAAARETMQAKFIMGGAISTGQPDPFIVFLEEWEVRERAFDDLLPRGLTDRESIAYIAHYEEHIEPLNIQVAEGRFPSPTTRDGAVAALQKVLDLEDDAWEMKASLVRSVVGFLKGEGE